MTQGQLITRLDHGTYLALSGTIQGPSQCELNSPRLTDFPVCRMMVSGITGFLDLTCVSWEHHQRNLAPEELLLGYVISTNGPSGFCLSQLDLQ
jgi:hypothetical protein